MRFPIEQSGRASAQGVELIDSTLLVGLIGAISTVAAAVIARMPPKSRFSSAGSDTAGQTDPRMGFETRRSSGPGPALIVAGGIVLAATVLASVVESNIYQSHLLEYFDRHGSGSPVDKLEAARQTQYLWFSGVVGIGIVAIGLRRSRLKPSG